MSPSGFIIFVFRQRRFNGSGTANDFNIVNPLGGFCGFFVFSSTRFNGILNLLFYRWWQFNSSCISLALELFCGGLPQTYIGGYTYIAWGYHLIFAQNTRFALTCSFRLFMIYKVLNRGYKYCKSRGVKWKKTE